MFRQKHLGFNLIEIMITLVIIGILSSLAIPVYTQHIVKAERQEAELMLGKLALAMENYFKGHQTYVGASLKALAFEDVILENRYEIKISRMTDSDFQLSARPLAEQAKRDRRCGSLLVDSFGVKTSTGDGKVTECW